MDFSFTPQQQAWRAEVGAYLDSITPEGYRGVAHATVPPTTPEEFAWMRDVHKGLAAKGWLVLSWPIEYGGAGASVIDQLIFTEEYAYRRLPHLGPGVNFVGPSLAIHGSDRQKAHHLPPIAAAETVWCQGFSEPGTGSDLASLTTRATVEGDGFVVNGTKIWTTNAHRADWCWLAVRTDTAALKHKGISVLLVDMRSPGVTVVPVRDLTGGHSFNQVLFDEVRVPRENLVGGLHDGWRVLTTTLDYERSTIASAAFAKRTLEDLVEYAKHTIGQTGRPLAAEPGLAAQLASRAIEVEVARLLAYQTASVLARGKAPSREASLSKLFVSQLLQSVSQTAYALLGPEAVIRRVPSGGSIHRPVADFALQTISATMAGGTSEVQRGIIATRGLGMPR